MDKYKTNTAFNKWFSSIKLKKFFSVLHTISSDGKLLETILKEPDKM